MNISFEQQEKFTSPAAPNTSFLFVPGVKNVGDILFLGSDSGVISYTTMFGSKVGRPEEFTNKCTNNHRGAIACMFLTFTERLLPNQKGAAPLGILVTGGRDATIKIWNPNIGGSGVLLQTLVGHRGIITGLSDAKDGTFVSCSIDGLVKLWAPQKGRAAMLNPYFECVVSVSLGRDVWAQTMIINFNRGWTCFVGDSNGNVVLLRKGTPSNGVDIYSSQFTNQLSTYKVWEKVHSLGLVASLIIEDQNFLVTTSVDASCKVMDAVTGASIFSFTNPRTVSYVGVEFDSRESILYLVDELGFLDVCSLNKGTVLASMELLKKTTRQLSNVLTMHKDKLVGSICNFTRRPNSLLILLPHTKSIDVCRDLNAGTGVVTVWERLWDMQCTRFNGHEGGLIAVSALSENMEINSFKGIIDYETKHSSHSPKGGGGEVDLAREIAHQVPLKRSSLRVIFEELLFFSVGMDFTVRGWDEYEKKEAFQHKKRIASEMTCARMLWSLNVVATGHDDGSLYIRNVDSGSGVESKSLKQTVSCFVEGRNKHSHVLLGSDYSGKIAMWNLTLFQGNPTQLPCDSVRQGFHDTEEAGILSLAFHWHTRTVFSGGIDRTIRYWKLGLDAAQCLEGHQEPVCSLECAHDFLVSGDESGEVILWKLSYHNHSIVGITKMCRWPVNIHFSLRAVMSINQVSPDRLFVLQAGLVEKAIVWEVEVKSNEPSLLGSLAASCKVHNVGKLDLKGAVSASEKNDAKSVESKSYNVGESKNGTFNAEPSSSSSAAAATGGAGGGDFKGGGGDDEDIPSENTSPRDLDRDGELREKHPCIIYSDLYPGHSIKVMCSSVIAVAGFDIPCCQLTVGKDLRPSHVYLGTTEGPIFKYQIGIGGK